MKIILIYLSLFFLFILPSKSSLALPRFAIEEGVNCLSCHTSPTGAGKRSDAGGYLFMQDLSLKATQHIGPKEIEARLLGFVTLGGDVLVQNSTQIDGTVNDSLSIPEGALYLEANPSKHLIAYIDYDLANTTNQEMFVMIHRLPLNMYVRAGRINLPYGLRVPDDTAFTRTNFNMSFQNQDIGAEFGIFPGPFEAFVAVSNGVPGGGGDQNLAKAVTASVGLVGKPGRVAASFHYNKRPTNRLTFVGLNGGFHLWRLIAMTEFGVRQDESFSGGGTTWTWAGIAELDLRVVQGLYALAVYDALDPDNGVGSDLQHRIGGGFDIYPLRHSKLSLYYHHNIGVEGAASDEIFSRVQFFY